MREGEQPCIQFLKWALPRLDLRWEGFRKVHGQVCKRINKRMHQLGLEDYNGYRSFLENHRNEWDSLEQMTHISISRFFRDRMDWEELGENLLPTLAQHAVEKKRIFRCWSAGCASGEEPYSMAILWRQKIIPEFSGLTLKLIATDADEYLLHRAKRAIYSPGSIKEAPEKWIKAAFEKVNDEFRLRNSYRTMVDLHQQDIRKELPEGIFDLIFCKNLVAMYFRQELAVKLFRKIIAKLREGGLLVLGNHETVPEQAATKLVLYRKGLNLYQKQ